MSEVVKANIELHTALAHDYNQDPHFRNENIENVKKKLSALKTKVGANTILDIGCGTGFMINIATQLGFNKIVGYDITPAMIQQVIKSPAVETKIVDVTKKFPASDQEFDMVCAYTFLSHLEQLDNTFSEAFRVLKKGGVFFSDLDPNFYFWNAMDEIDLNQQYHPYVQREVLNTKKNDLLLQEKYGISPETYNTAEHQKTKTGGMKEEDLKELLLGIGFSSVVIKYNWFVGQAVIINNEKLAKADRSKLMSDVDEYLQSLLPLSRRLYKYISFEAYK